MPSCSAFGCSMRPGTNLLSKIKMCKFPTHPYRRRLWELAVRRKDWTPTKSAMLCSLHFVTGQPSKDKNDPDYVPSIFSYNTPSLSKKKASCKGFPNCERKISDSSIIKKNTELIGCCKENANTKEGVNDTFNHTKNPRFQKEINSIAIGQKRKLKQSVLRIMLLMLEEDITQELFSETCNELSVKDYDELTEERLQCNMCSHPMCNNYMPIIKRNPCDVNSTCDKLETWMKHFCSWDCYQDSNNLKLRMSNFLLRMELGMEESLKLPNKSGNSSSCS